MNKVLLTGRLTADITEIRKVGSGENAASVCDFCLAIPRFAKKGEHPESDFIDCVAWNGQASFLEKFGKKGTKFEVIGSIQTGVYTDKDGKRRKTTKVIAQELSFAERKSDGQDIPAPHNTAGRNDVVAENSDDDLPF